MPDGKRRRAMQEWLESDLPAQFEGRVLSIDRAVAIAWGELSAQADNIGRPLPVTDGLLLATAKAHRLTLITRNVSDVDNRRSARSQSI